ncbi:hypothetical protein Pmani_006594 [Petrolisthes manimaculis]|uniref:Ionotropic glutamate receptor L-glutamate and glycine-binding domain-containing protein n=1 Tax=Petrolisthes manimaculis TaxID=1843537 RepID=A0AAE1QBE6_9EUCA|nr:hypothetical protein Pmani_006594 [Petrolisthes manimaculis]
MGSKRTSGLATGHPPGAHQLGFQMSGTRIKQWVWHFPVSVGLPSLPGFIQVTPNGPNGTLKVFGPLTRIMTIIAASLNSCVEYTTPSDNLFGNKDPNGNWTGILGLTQTMEVDLTGTAMTLDLERWEDFSVSVPLRSYDREIVYIRPVPEADLTGFIRPYTPLVWCLVLVTLLVVWVTLWVTQHHQADLTKHRP